MKPTPVCIVKAKRTAQGRFLGALSACTPVQLGVAAGKAALDDISPSLIDQVIIGRELSPNDNIARLITVQLGIPYEVPSYSVNMYCASSIKAVALGADAIRLGQIETALVGGIESMSQAPHLLARARKGFKLAHMEMRDSLLDTLLDPVHGEQIDITAERLVEQYAVRREAQDAYAHRSHMRARAAQENGSFTKEIVPLPELDHDEGPRADSTLEKLASLKPAFRPHGTITAGNASGISDGAAMMVICSEKAAQKHGWTPLCYLTGTEDVGCDPKIMGIGPVHAIRRLRDRKLSEFDTIEINEAFAAQVLACLRELKIDDDADYVNPDGGAISLGHPIGASGARLMVHLAHRIAAGTTERGLASLCVGGGMGIVSTLEKNPS